MALSKKMLEQEPSEIEMLLPWHAAGTLNARDARRVDEALARDPRARQAIRGDPRGIRRDHSSQREPRCAVRARDAEAVRRDRCRAGAQAVGCRSNLSARISDFFASLSPRTLAWSASLGALALLLQAGVIGAVLMKNQPASFQTASLSMNEPSRRHHARSGQRCAPPRALVRFAPDARVADITALLDNYQASIIDGAKGGMFRLQFGNKAMSKDEVAGLMSKLQKREDRQSRGGDAVRSAPPLRAAVSRGPMVHDGANWRMKTRRAALALAAAVLPFAAFRRLGGSCAKHHAHAQPQHRAADSEHQSDGGAADQSEHRRPGGVGSTRGTVGERRHGRYDLGHAIRPVGVGACTLSALFAQSLSGLRVCLSRQRRRMHGRPVISADGGGNGGSPAKKEQRPAPQRGAGGAQSAHGHRTNRGRDRRLAVARRRPTSWRGATGWSGSRRRIFR